MNLGREFEDKLTMFLRRLPLRTPEGEVQADRVDVQFGYQ
jgi:hypothetical protein